MRWECGNTAGFAGFPRAVERVGSLGLAFHALHGPSFPRRSGSRDCFACFLLAF